MMPKISVCITSYNQKDYLIEAIESVLNQTLTPSQIIIVDDYSNDGSRDVIQEYVKKYPELITSVLHKENIGISKSRTDALNHVTGDYVTFLDGDDLFFPTKLETEYNLIEKNSDVKIAFSNYQYIDEKGNYLGEWAVNPPPQGNVFFNVFSRDYPKGSLYRNELVDYQEWKAIGFFDPKINLYEDYEMKIRLTYYFKTAYTGEVLSKYRRHSNGLSKAKNIDNFLALNYIYHKHYYLLNSEEAYFINKTIKPLLAKYAKTTALELIESQDINIFFKRYQTLKYLLTAIVYDSNVVGNLFLIKFLIKIFFPVNYIKKLFQ